MPSISCKICGNNLGSKLHFVKEMMLGLREEFKYVECVSCGALVLIDIPKDYTKYYPIDKYYSFNNIKPNNFLKNLLLNKLLKFYIGQFNFIWKILSLNYDLNRKYRWVSLIKNIPFNCKILDIGSGSGKYLLELFHLGYKNITGIDPFNSSTLNLNNNITIYNCEVDNLTSTYDFIIMNHSLEHIFDQDHIFLELKRLLNPGGKVLIRIPFIGYAWEQYGANWYQIDAPRHMTIHSINSFRFLCNKYNFNIDLILHDSTDYQFKFSEQYTKDLTLFEDGNFSNLLYKKWRKKANELNSANMGDQVSIMISIAK